MNKRRIGILVIVFLAIAAFMVWRTYFRKEGRKGCSSYPGIWR